MAVTVNLPSLDLIGISGATTAVLSADIELAPSTIYVTEVAEAGDYSVTLPATANDGETILIKNLGSGEINIASTRVDGVDSPVDITNNQPVRFVFHSATIGWIIA